MSLRNKARALEVIRRMCIEEILKNTSCDWMGASGPDSDVVISSRIRLARNLDGHKFPQVASSEELAAVKTAVRGACREIEQHGGWGQFCFAEMHELSSLDRQVLVEKHLISPHHAQVAEARAVWIRDDEAFSVMINEEDHLRLQCLFSGMQLEQAWVALAGLDDALEARLDYAYCRRRGYLTACPTNVGTGLRASLMMHLPALVMAGLAGGVFGAAAKVGMVVRGLYGEGSEAIGNIFQVSNQITLGQPEEEIISNLQVIARQIIDQERRARAAFAKDMRHQVEDKVFRSYGILRHARILTSEEAMKRWSEVRLGYDFGFVKSVTPASLNQLIVTTRPASLQRRVGRQLGPFERDLERARLVRETLQNTSDC